MSDKVHYKGRFIKQKVLNKRLTAVAAMAEAKKRQINFNRMVAKLYPKSFEILMFIPLLLNRYHLLFLARVDLNSKIVIDSHLILKE